jgi:hypothetical protein
MRQIGVDDVAPLVDKVVLLVYDVAYCWMRKLYRLMWWSYWNVLKCDAQPEGLFKVSSILLLCCLIKNFHV